MDWKILVDKVWNNGIHACLEEVCKVIPSHFDDIALKMLDQVIDRIVKK